MLVPNLDVAQGQEIQQLAISPELAKIDNLPARAGLEHRNGQPPRRRLLARIRRELRRSLQPPGNINRCSHNVSSNLGQFGSRGREPIFPQNRPLRRWQFSGHGNLSVVGRWHPDAARGRRPCHRRHQDRLGCRDVYAAQTRLRPHGLHLDPPTRGSPPNCSEAETMGASEDDISRLRATRLPINGNHCVHPSVAAHFTEINMTLIDRNSRGIRNKRRFLYLERSD